MFFSFHFRQNKQKQLFLAIGSCLGILCLLTFGIVFHEWNHTVGCTMEDLQDIIPVSAQQPEHAEPSSKVAYLTFDDGPSSITESVLDTLKKEQVLASFFVIAAPNNESFLPILTRSIAEGHCIALHSCTHEYRDIYSSPEAYWKDIDTLKEKLQPYLGETMPRHLRFPGGSSNTVSHKYGGSQIMNTLKKQATERGYVYIDWNACANDAVGGNPSADTIARTVIQDCKNKNQVIILMHDTKKNKNTVQALPTIIGWLKEQGYTFDTVNHLS